MTPEQQAAYVISQSVSALIEAMGMMSHNNSVRGEKGEYHHYKVNEFTALIDKYAISHNAVLTVFGS